MAYDGNNACAVVGDVDGTNPILDNGAAYSTGRELGKNYGWDCDGSLVFPIIPAQCIIDSSSVPVSTLSDSACAGADQASCEAGSVDGQLGCRWLAASTKAGQPVDQSGGIRAPPREIYGMNHFDRNGGCPGLPTNWNVGVANGYYNVRVDFAADSSGEERRQGGNDYGGWDNCNNDHIGEDAAGYLQVEGRIACYHRPGCMY